MSDLISYHLEDGIATLTLSNGKVNAISPEVIVAFNSALDQAEQDRAVVIITGQPGILSGGYDLKVMTSGPENAISLVTAGSSLARRLLAHPFPVVVACPGHAVAKGAFLLLSVDYRIGVDGPFSIGLNEVQIGMTMHHAGIELARDRLSKSAFHRSVINAEMFDPQGALQAGFLDKVVAPEELHAAALEAARQLKKINMTAHKQTKLKVRKALLGALDEAIIQDQSHGLS
ncbi:crotonase/enoyl-CoA hydratase family protein [Pseudomonas sp. RTB3]|nr:crotonase/enoyl-CoA hydratase family protein [Pseudomonas sp. RTB3]